MKVAACFGFVLIIVLSPIRISASDSPLLVVEVVDSDLVIIRRDGRDAIIRMLGVGPPPRAASHPYESVLYLRLLLEGHKVYLKHEEGLPWRDVYGREVGYLFRSGDGEFVNRRMIADGYATFRPDRAPLSYESDLRTTEQLARNGRRGLWTNRTGSAQWETEFKGVRYLGEMSYTPNTRQQTIKPAAKAAVAKATTSPPPRIVIRSTKKQ